MPALTVLLLLPLSLRAQEWKNAYVLAQNNWGQSWKSTVHHLQDAERTARHDLGIFDSNYLIILNDLGLALFESGKIDEAIDVLEKSVRLRQEVLGSESRELHVAQLNLARVQRYSNPEKAEQYLSSLIQTASTNIQVKAVKSLYDLYMETTSLERASDLLEGIEPKTTEMRYVKALLQADVNRRLGLYKESQEILDKLKEELFAKNSDELLVKSAQALFYDQLGMLSPARHELKEAESAINQAIELRDYLGRPPEESILSYNNLAILYQDFGLYNQALNAVDSALSRCSHHCENLLQNKASIYLITGKPMEAELIYSDIFNNYTFRTPTEELEFLLNYANTFKTGSLSQANPALERARLLVGEYGEALPIKHLGHYYAARGTWLVRQGQLDEAIVALERSRTYYIEVYGSSSFMLRKTDLNLGLCYLTRDDIQKGLQFLAWANEKERKLIQYVYPMLSRSEQQVFMSDLRTDQELFYSMVIPAAQKNAALRELLFEKQLIFKGLTLLVDRTSNRQMKESIPAGLRDEYEQLRKRLANAFVSGDVNSRGFEEEDIRRLKLIETRIARETGIQLAGLPSLDSIRSRLTANESLIEIIRFTDKSSRISYAGLIVDPISAELGLAVFPDGGELESRQLKYHLNTIQFEIRDTVSYEKFWKPLEPFTSTKEICYLVSDGFFHKINPAGLWDNGKEKFLGEQLQIRQLNNSVEILGQKSTASKIAGEHRILLVGDPNLSETNNSRFQELPGTRQEIDFLRREFAQKGWEIEMLSGAGATKTALLDSEFGSIIHFATHGFFSVKEIAAQAELPDLGLFRSGLVLSADQGGSGDLLTAFEITDLPLHSVNLAVLSACETGLGELRNGDGVYGLQFAFMSAGAKSVLISLWQVNDALTKEYMEVFYKQLLKTGNKRLSYESAVAVMRQKYEHPKYWAPFIYLGD